MTRHDERHGPNGDARGASPRHRRRRVARRHPPRGWCVPVTRRDSDRIDIPRRAHERFLSTPSLASRSRPALAPPSQTSSSPPASRPPRTIPRSPAAWTRTPPRSGPSSACRTSGGDDRARAMARWQFFLSRTSSQDEYTYHPRVFTKLVASRYTSRDTHLRSLIAPRTLLFKTLLTCTRSTSCSRRVCRAAGRS